MGKWFESPEDKLRRLLGVMGDGCWIPDCPTNNQGYHRTWFEGRHQLVHRVAYAVFVGPIPDGMKLDHLCRNRECCNPDHLEVVTQRENLMRGPTTETAQNARKTHCKRGHLFDKDNTRVRPNGNRSCLTCDRMTPSERREWDNANRG